MQDLSDSLVIRLLSVYKSSSVSIKDERTNAKVSYVPLTGISVGGLPDGIVDGDTLASGVGGKIIKYKQVVKTDTFTSSSNGTDIPGLSVTMDAPASSSSKYLIFANVPHMGSNYG